MTSGPYGKMVDAGYGARIHVSANQLVLRPSGLFRSLAHARGSVLALNRDRKGADLPVTALVRRAP
jgi:hypothetical protein